MRVCVISNIREGKGLAKDARLLERLMESFGHEIHLADFRDVDRRDLSFTAVIHLEVVAPKAFSWSDQQLLVANPDWLKRENLQWLPAFRYVLAKTREGERVLRGAGVKRVVYVGFESQDRNLKHVARERVFLHSWASSIMKGTRQVLAAWRDLKYPTSFLVGQKMPEAEYHREQNRCLFHVQPSAVEGYGHILHEALSVGALLATVDGPPMNESTGIAFLIPARKVSRQNLADVYESRPEDIAEVARQMWGLTDVEVAYYSKRAREGYLADREAFRVRFRELLEGL